MHERYGKRVAELAMGFPKGDNYSTGFLFIVLLVLFLIVLF